MPHRGVALILVVCLLAGCNTIYRHPKTTIIVPTIAGMVLGYTNAEDIPVGSTAEAVIVGALGGGCLGVLVFLAALVFKHPPHDSSSDGDGYQGGYSYDDPLPADTGGGGCYDSGAWTMPAHVPGESPLVATDGQHVIGSTGSGHGFSRMWACMEAKQQAFTSGIHTGCSGGYGQLTGYFVYSPSCTCTACDHDGENGTTWTSHRCEASVQGLCSASASVRVTYGWSSGATQDAAGQAATLAARVLCNGTETSSYVLGCQRETVNQGMSSDGTAAFAEQWLCGGAATCAR